MSNSSVERIIEFLKWLSRGFLYDSDSKRKATAKLYYTLVKHSEEKRLSKILDFSKSSLSRWKSRLTEDGIFYEIFRVKGEPTTFLIPLHPYLLIRWIASNETYTDMTALKDKFGVIIDELESAWQENFGALFQEECYFPIGGKKGWPSYIAYCNFFSWLLSCTSQLQKVILLTPHLRLLKDPCFRKIILELSKDIEFEFFAFLSSTNEEIKTILQESSIKIWTLDPNDRNIPVNLHTARAGVMINKEQVPILTFEVQKIPETESYVGVGYINSKHSQNTLRALENLKRVTEQYIPQLLQAS